MKMIKAKRRARKDRKDIMKATSTGMNEGEMKSKWIQFKGHVGLGDPGADLLHGDHGSVQPGGEQELLQ